MKTGISTTHNGIPGKDTDSPNHGEMHLRPLHTSGCYQVALVRLKIAKKNVHVPAQNGTEGKCSMFSNSLLPHLFYFLCIFTYSYEKLKKCFAGIPEQLLGFIAQGKGS